MATSRWPVNMLRWLFIGWPMITNCFLIAGYSVLPEGFPLVSQEIPGQYSWLLYAYIDIRIQDELKRI